MTPSTRATTVVDGLVLARSIRQQLTERVARHVDAGRRPPCRAVVVGDDPASQSYIKGKRGVGPMTITMLLRNTLSAYEERQAWRA